MALNTESITLGGGCFWCLEAVFERVDGVVAVESGYSNGHTPNPTYEAVCSGRTGHVEVVRVEFDPGRITLHEILAIFFTIHDPTTLNRQGNDVGTQYRSGIYFHTADQEPVAREVIEELAASGTVRGSIVTELKPVLGYSRAEEYHQRYFDRNPGQGYCAFVVAPKVEKFRQVFATRVRDPH
ncbi:MAG: peptide-methionine (S)-S-oxide reductase MsrA [Ideonella sp.]|nr:peptide-methionine (S)-S-oxide reductase MsrA [Ideonella sp.]